MGESNDTWGALVESAPDMASRWDSYARLPEAGENVELDAFCASKHITIPALVRVGAKLSAPDTLAFGYPSAIKFRSFTGEHKRWAYFGSEFPTMKIIPSPGETDTLVICEGETDAAWLSARLPSVDVGVLPAGARTFTPAYAEQAASYNRVLVATDTDAAGEAGYLKIRELVPYCVRFAPPGNDWCEGTEAPDLPDASEDPPKLNVLVSAGELLELDVPENASWFEHDILPIGGLMILHGWAKSFKTFIAIDMLSRIAQGQDWCCFEPCEEPAKVAIIQYEVAWPYYRKRVEDLAAGAAEPDLFRENFLTYAPLSRPKLQAGDTASEDAMLHTLVDGGVQVVLFDPIRRMMGALDFNSEADTRKVLGFFSRLQDEGITVVATHHDNKEFAKFGGGDPRGMTGSGSFTGDPDTLVSVSLPKGDRLNDSDRRNISFTLRNSPAISTRGMSMREVGGLIYQTAAHGPSEEDDGDDSSMPSI